MSSTDAFDTLLECDEYDTLQECCDEVFEPGEDCQYEDICNTSSPTISPSISPTLKPTENPTQNPTNNPTSKPARNPTRNPTRDPTNQPSQQPSVSPTLMPTTPSPTTCEERKWHFSPQINGCANTEDMDPDDEMAFDTLVECCEAEFGSENCDSYDMCAPTAMPSASPTTPSPTRCEEDRKWHPNSDSSMCTNAGMSSTDAFDTLLECDEYDTLQECCDEVFEPGEDCQYEDICNTPSPTLSPSISPTLKPTENPTKNPTQKPTNQTTQQPTESPILAPSTPSPTTCEGRKWHFSPDINGCANTEDMDPDDEMTFDTLAECCEAKFGIDACNSYDMCAPTASPSVSPVTPSPTICEDRKWRPNDDSTMCINAGEWTSNDALGGLEVYDNLQDCCEEIFEDETCVYEDICLTLSPTTNPSNDPTANPVGEILTKRPSPAPTPCEGRKWYLLSTKTILKQCTNGYDIPRN